MAAQELAILDGRYQLLRQLSGSALSPLMVATDLLRGRVVCLRLQQFNTSMANLAAVPMLATEADPTGDGPLLPYDFGVDDGIAYLVRDYVTATTLEQRLTSTGPPSATEVISILRRSGQALQSATAQGFRHSGLTASQILVTTDGLVRVAGYDQLAHPAREAVPHDGGALVDLVIDAFGGRPRESLPAPVRGLLTRCAVWKATAAPDIATAVHHLALVEDHLLGRSRVGTALATTWRALGGLLRRCRRLGPLLQPYLLIVALGAVIVALAVRALSAAGGPGRLYVYPIPTRAPAMDAADPYRVVAPPAFLTTVASTATFSNSPKALSSGPSIAARTDAPAPPAAVDQVRATDPQPAAERYGPAPTTANLGGGSAMQVDRRAPAARTTDVRTLSNTATASRSSSGRSALVAPLATAKPGAGATVARSVTTSGTAVVSTARATISTVRSSAQSAPQMKRTVVTRATVTVVGPGGISAVTTQVLTGTRPATVAAP